MYKFIELELYNVPEKGTVRDIFLEIDNLDTLLKFFEYDTVAYGNELVNLNGKTSHLGDVCARSIAVANLSHIAKNYTEVSELSYLSNTISLKHKAMLKQVLGGNTILVQKSGSFSLKDSFMEIWKAKLIGETESDGFLFPVSDLSNSAETVILENSSGSKYLINDAAEAFNTPPDKILLVDNLKYTDSKSTFNKLVKVKNIYIKTEAQDDEQVDKMAGMLLKLDRKNIKIVVYGDEVKHKLVNHKNYSELSKLHNLEIVDN